MRQRFCQTAATVATLATTGALADAELPAKFAVDPSTVSRPLFATAEPYCLDDRQGGAPIARSTWQIYKMPIDRDAFVYFVQCRVAATNDLHAVVVEKPRVNSSFKRFAAISTLSQTRAGMNRQRQSPTLRARAPIAQSNVAGNGTVAGFFCWRRALSAAPARARIQCSSNAPAGLGGFAAFFFTEQEFRR